jgi:hypothetical protein
MLSTHTALLGFCRETSIVSPVMAENHGHLCFSINHGIAVIPAILKRRSKNDSNTYPLYENLGRRKGELLEKGLEIGGYLQPVSKLSLRMREIRVIASQSTNIITLRTTVAESTV